MSNFVVLTSQRTGSKWLMDLLAQQEDCESFGELFLPRSRKNRESLSNEYPRFIDWEPRLRWGRRLQAFSYCNGLYRRPGSVGFKLMYSQLKYFPELLAYFKLYRIRVIHLIRQNDLAVVISKELMKATGVAHRKVENPSVEKMQIRLDPADLVRQIRKRQRERSLARWLMGRAGIPFKECRYEHLTVDQAEFDSVVEYLDLGQRTDASASRLRKTGAVSAADSVANFAEIEAALVAANLAYLLD
jgi:LPS sulfotransferase NodH